MDERVKKLWTGALRSGEYKQGRNGYLREIVGGKPSDCCLGVLCDLFAKERPNEGKWVFRDSGTTYFETAGDSEEAFLPKEVKRWAGLDENNPELEGGHKASEWNDGEAYLDEDCTKATFADIADMVERYL